MNLKNVIKHIYFNWYLKFNPFISLRYIHLGKSKLFDIYCFRKVNVLPNFIILGSQKSGSTSLYKHLDYHPEIFMSKPIKEPGYFHDFNFIKKFFKDEIGINFTKHDQILSRIMLRGYMGQKYFGDGSTYYTINNFNKDYDIPMHMYRANPNMKFIYILRNPYARIVSRYLWQLIWEKEKNKYSFNDFVEKHIDYLVNTSCYYEQLNQYLKVFPKENFNVVIFEEYIKDTPKILNDLFSFLGLKELDSNLDFGNFLKSNNRTKFSKDDLKFSSANFKLISNKIDEDVKELERFLDREIKEWNLQEASWVNKTNV